jgi:hypothetical protein
MSDYLLLLMQQACTQDPPNEFIWDINMAPEPAIILAIIVN